jgi:hypothetical protein
MAVAARSAVVSTPMLLEFTRNAFHLPLGVR